MSPASSPASAAATAGGTSRRPGRRARARSGRPRELLEVERVAAAVGVDRGADVADELDRLGLAERRERQLVTRPSRAAPSAAATGAGSRPARAATREQHRAVGRRAARAPRARRSMRGRPSARRRGTTSGRGAAARADPAARDGAGAGRAGRVAASRVDRRACRRASPPGASQRLGPQRVRQVGLELRGPRREHEAAGRGRLGQVREQPRLADPRLALDRDDAAATRHAAPRARRRSPRARGRGRPAQAVASPRRILPVPWPG